MDGRNWLLVASFFGGVLSSSAVWYLSTLKSHGDTEENSQALFFLKGAMNMDDIRESLEELKNILNDLPVSFDDLKHRIGELPAFKKRRPWPWDRRKRKKTHDNVDVKHEEEGIHHVSADHQNSPSVPSPANPSLKSDFCIGSIFGMDVGGTLAKLVYFEQRAPVNSTTDSIGHRERLYRNAASAQTVIMARQGVQGGKTIPIFPLRPLRQSSLVDLESNVEREMQRSKEKRRKSEIAISSPKRNTPSKASSDDLLHLKWMRQQSEPDNLQAYADSVDNRPLPKSTSSTDNTLDELAHDRHEHQPQPTNGMRRSRSMLDFSRDRAEALDQFYSFARRLDSYREGVKDDKLSFYSRELQGEFHFVHFETRRMQQAMDLIRTNNLHLNIKKMGATGGGAHKFAAEWEKELGIIMHKEDELDSLVAGMQFVLRTVVGECYSFRPATSTSSTSSVNLSRGTSFRSEPSSSFEFESELNSTKGTSDNGQEVEGVFIPETPPLAVDEWWWSRKVRRDAVSSSETYPYLLVSIGTGVSILRVDGPRKYERISGSTIGGGTYWGLIRLLTDIEDFDDVMRMVANGDPTKVDMMVGDIYGDKSDALEKLGLPANLVASSFGKLVAKEDPASGLKQEDLARALLMMITNNIGQVAYLNAKLSKTKRIYFIGNFLRQNKISQRRLSFAIDYWSKGEMEALFLEHEGYFGALGAFLLSQNVNEPAKTEEMDATRTEVFCKPASSEEKRMTRRPSL
ncbi:type II pantothenate kinase [Fistulifera solaris]|uniref:pantothenate kinase n=1 Tax=Fistulifera solaris TaxID=1519565 RepID=A0A1Z5J7V7_FISSO|nr:type II pantothenate kinase [Fistulifera solaris]|eukprot:GAX10074.1 type II pantothenate kinase [Fistulifera solaris]